VSLCFFFLFAAVCAVSPLLVLSPVVCVQHERGG
jgi:hypothetical protein